MKLEGSSRECSKCDFFKGTETHDRDAYQRGECRLEPPNEHGFPEVYSDWWCGQFESYDSEATMILNRSIKKAVDDLL